MAEASPQRLVAVVRGRVQGVGFRAFTATRVRRLRLTGLVRNVFDGTVEVIAEGNAADLAMLVSWLHEGPVGARVDAVDVRHEPARGDLPPFDVAPSRA